MKAIYAAGGSLQLAVTLRDDLAVAKAGRIYLDEFCAGHQIPLTKITNINDTDSIAAIVAADLDWLFIVGWSQIAGQSVLSATRCGVLGMHPTLLPVGRGRAPIPWAILLGLPQTGVSLFKLDEGVDTGPIIAQHVVPIAERETAATLYAKVEAAHIGLIREQWSALTAGALEPTDQDEARATIWVGRKPKDGRIDPAMSVKDADRLIRAASDPYPGAFIDHPEGCLRIWEAGAPGVDLGSNQSTIESLRLTFPDGWIDATRWVRE